MKLQGYEFPHSSFLSVEKDMSTITEAMLKNDRLKKMLFYTTQDALFQPNLTQEQSYSLLNNQIKIIPKLQIDKEVLSYIIINFDNFVPNDNNPEFRDNTISFDIICHFDQWQLKDFQLRPYRIAAELDTMFNDKKMSGIGVLQFVGASQIILTDEFAGLSLIYAAVHGGDDEKNMLNPKDQIEYNKFFDEMINNG